MSTALTKVPGTATFIGRPTKDVPYWEIDVDSDYRSYHYRAVYNSDTYVLIDPHDANHVKVIDDARGQPAGNRFYDKFFEPAHFGWQVDGGWRVIWVIFGLAPLALLITGVSTWLYRRGVKKRRRARLPADVAERDDLEAMLEDGRADEVDPELADAESR